MAVKFLTLGLAHGIAKSFLTNCEPLSVSTNSGIPNGTIQLSKHMSALCVDDVVDSKTMDFT